MMYAFSTVILDFLISVMKYLLICLKKKKDIKIKKTRFLLEKINTNSRIAFEFSLLFYNKVSLYSKGRKFLQFKCYNYDFQVNDMVIISFSIT